MGLVTDRSTIRTEKGRSGYYNGKRRKVNGQFETVQLRGNGTNAGTVRVAGYTGVVENNVPLASDDRDASRPEIWSLTQSTASAGTFIITIDGDDTAEIAFNADAATIQTAVQAISPTTTVQLFAVFNLIVFADTDEHEVEVDDTGVTGAVTVTKVQDNYDERSTGKVAVRI